ncbi:MAG: phenylalanine--tRNA ligase subunit beta [Candidatus Cloacimonas sp.]
MIFSYKWLQEYYDSQLTPDELAKLITFGGIEVEGIRSYPENLSQIKVVKIVSLAEHPQADKLNVCQIDDGDTIREVVCGAPNCRVGMLTAYAPIGAVVGESVIEQRDLRGINSNGMLCSEKELGLKDGGPRGIVDIPDDVPLGTSLTDYLGIEDTVFEVEITPNRPDLLGIIGIARDVAALSGEKIELPKHFPTDGLEYSAGQIEKREEKKTLPFELKNETPELCPRYIARVITGVKVKESPEWLKERLLTVGITPINNIVDVTNYVMMEFGHPLHAFDYDLLAGNQIRIRRAKENEELLALDHKKHKLTENDLLIADRDSGVAIAGVIGSEHSAISERTVNIVLEAANFYHLSVRKSAQRLKINTDSAYRFERNLSDETVAVVCERATALILELAGGEISETAESFPKPNIEPEVSLRISKTNKLLTTDLTADEVIEYLSKIGISISEQKEDVLTFRIPFYRKDITREIDLIEEVIRLYGYNNIESGDERISLMDRAALDMKRRVADYLVFNGFYEAINSSFTELSIIKALNLEEGDQRLNCWELINPLGVSFSLMRTTLLPGLLKNTLFNLNNGQEDIKLFEMGKVFLKEDETPLEKRYLSAVITGDKTAQHWKYKSEKENIFTTKGYVEGILRRVAGGEVTFSEIDLPYYQSGLSLEVFFNGSSVGYLGKVDPFIAKRFDIEVPLFAFEIEIDKAIKAKPEGSLRYQEINKYPIIDRDISFIVDKKHLYSDIVKEIYEVDSQHIRACSLIDEFTGKGIPENHRSLTFNMNIGADNRTLTDEFVSALVARVIETLKKKFEIEMR